MEPLYNFSHNFQTEIRFTSKLKNLFQLAESGEWEKLFTEISREPNLVNTTFIEGGETLLWKAIFHCVENYNSLNDNQILSFIQKLIDFNISLNINAAPTEGPHRGKSVFWLLLKFITLRYDDIKEPPFKPSTAKNLIRDLLEMDPHCNLNSAPEEGDFQGVTAFCLMLTVLEPMDLINFVIPHAQVIKDSAPPPFQNEKMKEKANVIFKLTQVIFLSHVHNNIIKELNIPINTQEIRNHCFRHLLKILENNPFCDVKFAEIAVHKFMDRNPFEMILSVPPFRGRDQLLYYFILCGLKITDIPDEECKKEYEEIRGKLKTIFDKARMICLYDLAEGCELSLVRELRPGIAINMILSAIPELENFPLQRLIEKLIRGFS